MSAQSNLVVVVGETASGKSDLAVLIAEKFNGEIICADAMTVRRAVDIGTAKPSRQHRARVAHHLLDVVEPCADFTAAVFKREAVAAIDDITNRGKLAVMTGGTGLYIDGVLYDYGFLPAGNRLKRQSLSGLSIEQLRSLIRDAGLDDSGLDVRNKRRLIRLLETGGEKPTRSTELRSHTLVLGLLVSRNELESRVRRRTEAMLKHGLEQEAGMLAERYGWECEALKGIGYREWREYFGGTQTLEETVERINKSTLDLAKRQRTWFKRNNSIHWVEDQREAVDLVTTFLSSSR